MYGSGFKIHKLFKNREKFFWKLSCLVVKKRLYVGYVLLVFAYQMQTKKKQGFKIDFNFRYTSVTLLSPFNEKCFCFCFKTFLMFWLSVKNFAFSYLAFVFSGFFNFDWSVRQNAPWMNQNCFVVTWLMTYVCLHFLHPHRKKTYIKKLSNILLTDPQLTWGGNLTDFNFLRSISTFCTYKKIKLSAALSQWACWKFCNLPSLWSEVHNLIPVHRITPFCSEALLSSPNLVLPACSLALVDNYN